MLSEPALTDRIRALAPTRDDSDWADVVARSGVDARPLPAARRRLPRPLLVAAAGAAAVAALAVLPARLGDDDVTLVERALAAVSGGPVLHAVLEIETEKTVVAPEEDADRYSVVDLETGRERKVLTRIELWYDAERKLLHNVASVDGAVLHDTISTGTTRIDPALSGFLRGYKQALAEGSATRAGEEVVDGRTVEWIRFPVPGDERMSQEVGVAPEAGEGLYLRTNCPSCDRQAPTYRIETLAGVSAHEADFSAPATTPPSRGRYGDGGRRTVTLTEAHTLLGRTPLWAGERVAGLDLSLVHYRWASGHTSLPTTPENRVGRGDGLVFMYGVEVDGNGGWHVPPGKPYVAILQSEDYRYGPGNFNRDGVRPLTVAGAPVPSDGEVALSYLGAGWIAQLARDGLYVEVQASSRALALSATRALEPLTR